MNGSTGSMRQIIKGISSEKRNASEQVAKYLRLMPSFSFIMRQSTE